MLLQILFVLLAIIIGAKIGGVGLGIMGGLGLAVLTFVFGLQPTAPPIDVMLMIAAVITAASCMQAAGGLDLMVKVAERLLRKHPERITILSPLVTYFFTFIAGTGHIAYSVLPVIAEVATESKVRPERPLGIAVIASQQAITASPISAATVALLALLANQGISLFDILKITVPTTLLGVIIGSFFSLRVGKELKDDPEYKRRVAEGLISESKKEEYNSSNSVNPYSAIKKEHPYALISIILFLMAMVGIVIFGSVDTLRPSFNINGTTSVLGMPAIIEIIMLSAAALIMLICKAKGTDVARSNVFSAGMQAVIAIFGIAWMGDTFINGNIETIRTSIEGVVQSAPWLFGIALFVMSILLYSQAATVTAFMPMGIALGIAPMTLIALFPAVNGYFFIPNYPTVVAAINFDRTGSTRIGKYVLNHSFMMPGLIATIVGITSALLMINIW